MTIAELRAFLAKTNLPDDAQVLVDIGPYWATTGVQAVPVGAVTHQLYDLDPCQKPNALLLYSLEKPRHAAEKP